MSSKAGAGAGSGEKNDAAVKTRGQSYAGVTGAQTGGRFRLKAPFGLTGDQPQAVEKLVAGIKAGKKHQTLLGVTGSGKTFTIANVIEQVQRPTLIISHNKTLAAQLCGEFKEFFPEMKDYDLVALFPLGYPAEDAEPSDRHALRKDKAEMVKYL